MLKEKTPLQQLDDIISETAAHFQDFTTTPTAFTRNRKLNFASTIKTALNMQGKTLNTELINAFPNLNDRMTASAYVQAKNKLKPEVFEHIFHTYNKSLKTHKRMDEYRLFAIDGTDFNPIYNKNSAFVMQAPIGRPKKDGSELKPFCQVHANLLYDLENKTYQDCILQPRSKVNERDAALEMLHKINCDDKYIVIMDRGYDGFNMIENCNRLTNCNYVIRTKAGKGGISEIASLPDKEYDADMSFRVTTSGAYYMAWKDKEKIHLVNHHYKQYKETLSKNTKESRWDFGKFCTVKCRVVKFRINNPDTGKEQWEVLVTNLNRFQFPVSKMKELYMRRWGIETSFRDLKYAIGGMQFHSKKDDFVRMEIFANLIMFNAVSRTISHVKVPKQNSNKRIYAVSFKDACTIARKYFRQNHNDFPTKIYAEILAYIMPVRKGRQRKRSMKPKSAIGFMYRIA